MTKQTRNAIKWHRNAIKWQIDGDSFVSVIRDVRSGPDGLLYLLTDENPGAVLKIEPAP